MQVISFGQEDPLEKEMATHSVFLPGEFHGPRNLAGYHPRGCKESDTTEHTARAPPRMCGKQERLWSQTQTVVLSLNW